MTRLAIRLLPLVLILVQPFATAQPNKGATRPSPNVTAHEMSREEGFFHWVAAYGAPPDVVDRYARVFDAESYRRATADEFERTRYRDKVGQRISNRVRALTSKNEYIYVTSREPWRAASFGEYSFSSGSFPLLRPTHPSSFNYWVGGDGFDVYPFDLSFALNASDFEWSLPMSEAKASAFLKLHPDRVITLRILYSVTPLKNDVHSSTYYLTPFIHEIDVFADRDMTTLLARLPRHASAPHTLEEWTLKQESLPHR